MQTIQNLQGSTQLSNFDYTYNPVGTIATWTQQADSSTAVVNTLGYDAADQLTSAVQSGGGSASNVYGYDPMGNRLSETTASGTTAGQFNNLNQLTAIGGTSSQTVAGHTSAAVTSVNVNAVPATITSGTNFSATVPLPTGTNTVSVVAQPTIGTPATQREQIVTSGTAPTPLSYDADGNTTHDENGYAYQWDALNRLIKITYSSGATSNFAYDGLSRRVSIIEKDASGIATSTKLYLWISSEIAEERMTNNVVTKRFFPQGERQSTTNYYYTRDQVGSVRELMSSTGTIVSRMAYDPYGRTTTVSGTTLPTIQYAGYYPHQTSGLELTQYRAYDANTGRWLSRDPIAEKGGLDLYDYVYNNPISNFDPEGTCTCQEAAAEKSAILAVAAQFQAKAALYFPRSNDCGAQAIALQAAIEMAGLTRCWENGIIYGLKSKWPGLQAFTGSHNVVEFDPRGSFTSDSSTCAKCKGLDAFTLDPFAGNNTTSGPKGPVQQSTPSQFYQNYPYQQWPFYTPPYPSPK